jgi:hypothetical protein
MSGKVGDSFEDVQGMFQVVENAKKEYDIMPLDCASRHLSRVYHLLGDVEPKHLPGKVEGRLFAPSASSPGKLIRRKDSRSAALFRCK